MEILEMLDKTAAIDQSGYRFYKIYAKERAFIPAMQILQLVH